MESFNDELLNQSNQLSLQEYHTRLIPKLFPELNISKSDFLIELSRIESDVMCVHQDKLIDLKVIQFNSMDELKSKLLSSNLIENKHFKVKISIKNDNYILLSPRGFKLYLIFNQDIETIEHLLTIETIYSNYSEYQIEWRKKYIESDEMRIKRTQLEEFTSKLSISCNSTEIIRGLLFDHVMNKKETNTKQTPIKNEQCFQYKLVQNKNDEKKLILLSGKRKTQGDYKKPISSFASEKEDILELIKKEIEEFNSNRLCELMDGIDINDDLTEEETKQIEEMMEIIENDHNIHIEKNEIKLGNECDVSELIELIDKIK